MTEDGIPDMSNGQKQLMNDLLFHHRIDTHTEVLNYSSAQKPRSVE